MIINPINESLLYSNKINSRFKSVENSNRVSSLKKTKIILKPIIKPQIKQNVNFSIKIPDGLKRFVPQKQKSNIIINRSNPSIFYKNYTSKKKNLLPLLYKKNNVNIISKPFGRLEYDLENEITRKKRINSLEEQRNFIKLANPGDKNFRYAEQSPDFFKQEGLIVGSTNSNKKSNEVRKKISNIYETMDLNVKILDDRKKWKFKIKNEALKYDCDYVNNLNNWENEYINKDNLKNDKVQEKNKDKTKVDNLSKNTLKKKEINDDKIKEKKKVKIKL